MTLYAFTSPGLSADVHQRPDGRYGVTLTDTDAGMTVPTVHICASLADACDYALHIVNN